MKIFIKKVEVPNNVIRQCKINSINGAIKVNPISYSYGVQYDYNEEEEDIRDLHLFCLSIAMELIDGSIPTGEVAKLELLKINNNIQNDKKCDPDKYGTK